MRAPEQTATGLSSGPKGGAPSMRGGLAWPDLARTIAACFVVELHIVAPSAPHSTPGTSTWWTSVGMDSAGRWAVPVFVMLSGALLLDPRPGESVKSFYTKRLRRVGIPLVVWTAVYLALMRFYLYPGLQPVDLGRLVARGYPFYHLYFLYVIAGLYAITPFLRILASHLPRQQLVGLTGAAIVLPTVNATTSAYLHVGSTPVAVTFFLDYIGFYLAGFVLRDLVLRRMTTVLALTGALGMVGVEMVMARVPSASWLRDYNSPTTTVMALLLFIVFTQLGRGWRETSRSARTLKFVSATTLGVYLIHPILVIELSRRAFHFGPYPWTPGELLTATGTTIGLSFVAVVLLHRVPVIRRLL